MTREEFVAQKKASEWRISWRVVPPGILYSIFLGMILAVPCLLMLLYLYFSTTVRATILWELACCILLTIICVFAERDGRRRFPKLALKCPSCNGYLVFSAGEETLKTGRCWQCGQQIFDV